MSYLETIKKLKQKKLSRLYLLYGTEMYLIQEIRRKILETGLTEDDMEMNVSHYDLEETPIEDVITDAETYPFLGEHKVIFAHNPTFMKGKPDKLPFEHHTDVLLRYAENPVDYSTLVIVAPYEKLDERKKIFKQIKNNGEVVQCHPVREWDVDEWIDALAKEHNITIPSHVHELFVREVGTNLMALRSEMEKLALNVEAGGTITKEMAENLLSHSAETSGLKLVDAVMDQDLTRAIELYKDLQKANEEPIALTALLASQFRTIVLAKILKQKGYTENHMRPYIKAHPYVIKMALKRERKFSLTELESIIDSIAETDHKMKQGLMEQSLAFEMMLYQLMDIRKQGSQSG
ncbi:DNA polymerase III subunit delta [Thalassobacillus sp. CUG 92003]|uniref:DNA polymerase III subunit delta n=1 Tax=Thalassobacillus sp. CUG 92003 TaxID=2736641 RepID=UPI0015E773B2|nr:DNA polymerase III subunit delta [Thalassobacillus sp. CUG 92003]